MGYDLHITRADDWQQNEGSEITADEWLELVERDVELLLDPENGAYSVKWIDTSKDETVESGWFDWYDGNVFTTDPSPPSVRKLLALADTLDARVQGDEGEIYETLDDWASEVDREQRSG